MVSAKSISITSIHIIGDVSVMRFIREKTGFAKGVGKNLLSISITLRILIYSMNCFSS